MFDIHLRRSAKDCLKSAFRCWKKFNILEIFLKNIQARTPLVCTREGFLSSKNLRFTSRFEIKEPCYGDCTARWSSEIHFRMQSINEMQPLMPIPSTSDILFKENTRISFASHSNFLGPTPIFKDRSIVWEVLSLTNRARFTLEAADGYPMTFL